MKESNCHDVGTWWISWTESSWDWLFRSSDESHRRCMVVVRADPLSSRTFFYCGVLPPTPWKLLRSAPYTCQLPGQIDERLLPNDLSKFKNCQGSIKPSSRYPDTLQIELQTLGDIVRAWLALHPLDQRIRRRTWSHQEFISRTINNVASAPAIAPLRKGVCVCLWTSSDK
jgi:hypothetical protein